MLGIMIMVAMLSNNSSIPASETASVRLEARILEATAKLSSEQQLALYLGSHQSEASSARRYSEKARVERLSADPAIRAHFPQIREEWFEGSLTDWRPEEPLFHDVKELVQLKVMIARNVYFRGGTTTAESVRLEYDRIQRLRSAYRELAVFAGREVVYAASQDRQMLGNQEEFLFGQPPTQARLRKQAARFTFYRPGDSGSRQDLDDRVAAAEHLTLVFEGHGRDRALKLGGALSASDLSRRLTERRGSTAILVLDACQSHTFTRYLIDELRKSGRGSRIPVVITPEEYGQDFIKLIYGDRFLGKDLKLGRSTVQLGALMKDASIATSVYVPDGENVPAQIL